MTTINIRNNMNTEDDFQSSDEWYAHLQVIAKKHDNSSAVRDREGWTQNWESGSPEYAYYSEHPEHRTVK